MELLRPYETLCISQPVFNLNVIYCLISATLLVRYYPRKVSVTIFNSLKHILGGFSVSQAVAKIKITLQLSNYDFLFIPLYLVPNFWMK